MSGSTRMQFRLVQSIGRAVSLHNAPFGIPNEVNDGVALFGFGHLAFQFFERLAVVHTLHENVAIDLLDFTDFFGGKSAATEADRIDTSIGQGFTCCLDVRRYILPHERTSRDHYMRPDLDELVQCAGSADDRPVVDFDMARQLDGVYEYTVVADDAVVRNVNVCHKQAVLADHGLVFVARTTTDGNILADDGVVADERFCFLAGELEVLWDR